MPPWQALLLALLVLVAGFQAADTGIRAIADRLGQGQTLDPRDASFLAFAPAETDLRGRPAGGAGKLPPDSDDTPFAPLARAYAVRQPAVANLSGAFAAPHLPAPRLAAFPRAPPS